MANKTKEKVIEKTLFCAALAQVLVIILIGFFVFKEGLPVMEKYGIFHFLSGEIWNPTKQIYGIYPMIIGTFVVTLGALVLGVPLGVATAIFLAEIVSEKTGRFFRPAIELLAGIPSVVYGLFGMVLVKNVILYIERHFLSNFLPPEYQWGYSILTASIILAVMILPTIINISEDSIRSVPIEYREGSLALGATHWQTIAKVLLPAARSGILAAIVLGMGRALGETMAVIMVAGNTVEVPALSLWGIFAPVRTLTGNIALEMGYAGPEHQQALFATGIVLFVFIMILNLIAGRIARKGVNET
ncbi:phosphate ABC transporter permease subunit PstC [Candidatus Formimonas warabiya]|uniref:Phosphate transport system permease protein n=1 Tax=Formimonas warabiya TaxID=1761012 RepID=A0A3G1KN75_FORW1|nr:phosphate ABC transporter permease subunit PstC [Candidatus Formimonas warabiya]ATW23870.1 phosphate ABC transporter permease subunit PstC [Candidatus Formimonas warabiya]